MWLPTLLESTNVQCIRRRKGRMCICTLICIYVEKVSRANAKFSFWKKRTACHRSLVFFHQIFPIIFFLRVEKIDGSKNLHHLKFSSLKPPECLFLCCIHKLGSNFRGDEMFCFDWCMKSINTVPRSTLGVQIWLIDVSGFWIFILALIAATLVH